MVKSINTLSALVAPIVPGGGLFSLLDSTTVKRADDVQSLRLSSNSAESANPSPESVSLGPGNPYQAGMKKSKKFSATQENSLKIMKLSPFGMFINNKVGSSSPNQIPGNYARQNSSIQLPVQDRKSRDSGSLLFMLTFLGFLAYIIWDGIVVKESNIDLVVHGHDSYGNICGKNNRPIPFVEKSGKNYTSKPYTKYNLINAQLERYTLDLARLKQGELFYVKEFESIDNDNSSLLRARSFERTINLRGKREAMQAQTFDSEQQPSRDRLSLDNIQSTLMYQYPPMHGYSSSAPMKGQKDYHKKVVSSHNEESFEASASQLVHSFASMSPTTTSSASNRTSTHRAIYEEQTNNNDHYEHVLVAPTSTNTRSRSSSDGLSQNEVSSQLLYLTECVEYCPSDHIELIFYRCMPKNWRFSLFPNAINVTRTFIDDILTDMSHCYRELIYIFSLALVLSLALLILLRFLASIIIWSCLTLLISLFISMASYSWLNYYYLVVDLSGLMPHDSLYSDKLTLSDKWLIGSIFLTFVAFAIIGTIIFMRKRILLVTLLFRESGKAISDMPLLILQPVLTFAALILITGSWSIGLVCLQSMRLPIIDMNTGFVVFKAEALYKIMKWYHIFAFLWVSHFAIACQHYVIGSAVSKWYFSTNRYNLHSPIGTSVSELILYYLGSVALGSFLVAIFKVIRIITRQIQYLVQRNCVSPPNSGESVQGGGSNYVAQMPQSCCGSFSYVWRLFIWFFDNIVMIINRDAYVEIAIHGHSFLAGARQAFNVLASNPLRLLAIKSISNILLTIAKICVVFGTVSVAIILIEEKSHQLNYSWSPIAMAAMYAYIVAHWFLSVYEMVIDALFICYCEDYERSKKQEANVQIIGSNFMSRILNNGQMW